MKKEQDFYSHGCTGWAGLQNLLTAQEAEGEAKYTPAFFNDKS